MAKPQQADVTYLRLGLIKCMIPIQFSNSGILQHTESFHFDQMSICNLMGRICEDWKFSALIAGGVLSIINCVAAIFSGAYFFSICYAGLAVICIFAAKEIRDLGSLKKVSEELQVTNENLTAEVEKFKTLNGELQQNINFFRTENTTYRDQNAALHVHLQSFQTTSQQIQTRFQELLSNLDEGTVLQRAAARQILTESIATMQREYSESDAICRRVLQLFENKYQELHLISRDWASIFNNEFRENLIKLTTEIKVREEQLERLKKEIDRLSAQTDRLEQSINRNAVLLDKTFQKNPPSTKV